MIQELAQTSWLEISAALLAIAYLVLAMRENSLCWYAAFFSSGLYCYIFFSVQLHMESALQIFYIGMAIYGWLNWKGTLLSNDEQLRISVLPWQKHLVAVLVIILLTITSGYALDSGGENLVYLDAFTTWSAMLATILVAKKILENWIYWIIIDSVSIYLYLDRGLLLTAILFATYIIIAGMGFVHWYREFRRGKMSGYLNNTNANL